MIVLIAKRLSNDSFLLSTFSMKEKVEQQEMELNASNPRVFMEAQSASKEEVNYLV